MDIKIKIQNKSYILLKGEIKKKNQFSKMTKKIKKIRVKIDIKIKIMFLIEGWNWKDNNFHKRAKKKNQNNKEQIGKHNTINLI